MLPTMPNILESQSIPSSAGSPTLTSCAKKANSTRRFIQHNLHGCPRRAKEQAHMTYVRPILEYTFSVWDPYYQDQIHKVKMIQRQAARLVMNNFHPRQCDQNVTILEMAVSS